VTFELTDEEEAALARIEARLAAVREAKKKPMTDPEAAA